MSKKVKPNLLDRLVGYLSPQAGLQRVVHRQHISNLYEAAKPSLDRKPRTDRGSGDAMVSIAGDRLRVMARDLEANHDLADGILDTLVDRTIGRGIRYEPQVRGANGELHDEFNQLLLDRHERWSAAPEVTRELSRNDMERLYARTWFRDGEAFKVYHQGTRRDLRHATDVPLSLDVFEPDFCPMHYNNINERLVQGVRKNGWGKPLTYYFHKEHPGGLSVSLSHAGNYRAVSARYVNHLKLINRLGQTRGVSVFHSALLRLDDLKDYEEAERIAARISAKMVAAIRKGEPGMYGEIYRKDAEGNDVYSRSTIRDPATYENGMTFLDLQPGEDVEVFDSKRPSQQMEPYRNGQLKGVSAGVGTGFSATARSYDGTYSAQRQEMVEQQEHYEVLFDYFVHHSCKPDYQRFVDMCLLSGDVELDVLLRDIDMRTLHDVECYGSVMPWIDPEREAKATERLLNNNLISETEAIRRRGANPSVVRRQIARDQRLRAEMGIPDRVIVREIEPGTEKTGEGNGDG